jgi:hypothetical protein
MNLAPIHNPPFIIQNTNFSLVPLIWQELQPLLTPSALPPKNEFGFRVRNESSVVSAKSKSNKASK